MVNMATTRCRVLVVDDDKDTAQSFAYLLVGMGHEATFLTDPREVLETTQRMRPHLVFLDIGMPDLDGWEVARLLRKLYPQDDTLRLIAISGRGDDEARRKSRQAGFDAHVVKPVEVELVEAIVRQLNPHC
jgi:CheY-like chemotaxis protein